MRVNSDYIRQLRAEAGQRLPADFARRVVRGVESHRRRSRRIRLTAVTGVLCAVLAVSVVWLTQDDATQANLQRWKQVHSQVVAIEDTL